MSFFCVLLFTNMFWQQQNGPLKQGVNEFPGGNHQSIEILDDIPYNLEKWASPERMNAQNVARKKYRTLLAKDRTSLSHLAGYDKGQKTLSISLGTNPELFKLGMLFDVFYSWRLTEAPDYLELAKVKLPERGMSKQDLGQLVRNITNTSQESLEIKKSQRLIDITLELEKGPINVQTFTAYLVDYHSLEDDLYDELVPITFNGLSKQGQRILVSWLSELFHTRTEFLAVVPVFDEVPDDINVMIKKLVNHQLEFINQKKGVKHD